MTYVSNDKLPDHVKAALPSFSAQSIFRNVYNNNITAGKTEQEAMAAAWLAIKRLGYAKDASGQYVKKTDSYIPPENVRANAKKALEVREKMPPSKRGMTMVGIARARDLSNGKSLSLETVKRMKAYFDRHEVDKEGESWSEQGKGWQAWMGWGGDEGRTWVNSILNKIEKNNVIIKADISNFNTEKKMVFGWASVVEINGKQYVDSEGDLIDLDSLEQAAYSFMSKSRKAGINHADFKIGNVVESIVFTKAKQEQMGIDLGKVGWWIGVKIQDDDVWSLVKSGELSYFSIGGIGKSRDEQ